MPTQSPLQEAEQALLNKSSKLEVARQAVLTHDLAELAKADRDDVKRWKERKLFGGCAGPADSEEAVGDIIVCDDYHRNDTVVRGRRSWVLPLVLGTLGTAGLAGAAYYLLTRPAAASAPAAEHWDEVTEEKQADGTWKEIARRKLK